MKYKTLIKYYFLVCLFLISFILFLIAAQDHWVGFSLLYTMFVICLFSKTIISNTKLFMTTLFVVLVHNLFSLKNALFGVDIGGDKDAYSFHVKASLISNYGSVDVFQTGSQFYDNFLAAV